MCFIDDMPSASELHTNATRHPRGDSNGWSVNSLHTSCFGGSALAKLLGWLGGFAPPPRARSLPACLISRQATWCSASARSAMQCSGEIYGDLVATIETFLGMSPCGWRLVVTRLQIRLFQYGTGMSRFFVPSR